MFFVTRRDGLHPAFCLDCHETCQIDAFRMHAESIDEESSGVDEDEI
jgi:hypothetical protein